MPDGSVIELIMEDGDESCGGLVDSGIGISSGVVIFVADSSDFATLSSILILK